MYVTIAQLSDLHVEMSEAAMKRVVELAGKVRYDICVLTGDYRGETWGPYDTTLAGVERVRAGLKGPIYGVLGNHDTIRMVPGLEAMGIKMLLNECEVIERSGQRLHLGGIDDAHFYGMDDIGKVAAAIPDGEFSILISHTPEVYQQAALAGSARNYPALPATVELTSVWFVAKIQLEKDRRKDQSADDKDGRPSDNVENAERQQQPTSQKGKQRLRNVIET
jgi:predicted phosphodiesterase